MCTIEAAGWRPCVRTCVTATLLLASPLALAQHSPALDRVDLRLGSYYPKSDTTLSASTHYAGLRVEGGVNLEDDLGLDDRNPVGRARLDLLVGDSQGISFDYFSYGRDNTRTLTRTFAYAGNTYAVDASVHGKLDFDFGSATWRWWLGSGDDVFGIGLGAAYYRVQTLLEGRVSMNGEAVGAHSSSDDDAIAPLLALGWRHAFSDRLRMYADASGVMKNGGKLDGHIYNAALGLEWYPWRHAGVGVEYGFTNIKLNRKLRDYAEHLDLQLQGPSVFLQLRF